MDMEPVAPDLANMTFSASRTQTGLNCERRFGWIYIAGIEEPQDGAQDLGVLVHATLEQIKKTGALPDRLTEVGAIAAEALPHVEDFSLESGSEFESEFSIKGRHPWRGFKDIRRPAVYAPHRISVPWVVDYKTTSDFKYAKTPEELMHDPQAVLYAVDELLRDPMAQQVHLMWLYLHKKKPAAKPVRITMSREHAMRCFEALERVADRLQALADAAPAAPELRARYVLDVLQPNTDHCNAYRGCPHRTRCGNIPFFNSQTKGSKPVSLLAMLDEMDKENASPAPPPAGADPGAPGARPALALEPGGAHFEPTIELPTDAPADAPTGDQGAPTERLIEAAAPVAPPAEGINPPKRGRGRPPGAKNKPKAVAAETPVSAAPAALSSAGSSADAAVAELTQEAQKLGVYLYDAPKIEIKLTGPAPAPAAPASTAHRIETLYVGCLPRGFDPASQPVDFDLLIARAKVGIGPQDFRLFEYGKGNGLLLQMFEGIVQHDKPAAVVVVDPRSPEAILCLSSLRSMADTVVEALSR